MTPAESALKILAAKLAKHLAEVRAAPDNHDERNQRKGSSGNDQASRPKQFPVFHRNPSQRFMASLLSFVSPPAKSLPRAEWHAPGTSQR